MGNEKEAIALMERYEYLANTKAGFKEIEQAVEHYGYPAEHLTGFGSAGTCTLCKPYYSQNFFSETGCSRCFWYHFEKTTYEPCHKGRALKSYNDITIAETPSEFRDAFGARAKYMRKLHKAWKKDNELKKYWSERNA